MGKALGYFALLVGSLTIQTLPWGGAAPLGLVLAALGVGSREEPVTGGMYGALCGLCWTMVAGWGGIFPALLLGGAALAAGWMVRTLTLWPGWFLSLSALGALGGVVLAALAEGLRWELAGVWGLTVLVSPIWGLLAPLRKER